MTVSAAEIHAAEFGPHCLVCGSDACDDDRHHDGDMAKRLAKRKPAPATYALPVADFLAVHYPPPDELIPGMLARASHTLGHAKPGIGKSNLATTLAVSLAAGKSTLPGFDVRERAPALYLDGELPPALVQDRLRMHLSMLAGEGIEAGDLADHLRVVSRIGVQAEAGERLPSLATPEGREWLLRELDAFPAEFVFVDTVRALMRHPEHSLSDEEGWRPVEELLAELAARGVGVFYLHHDGKSGEQLGTSAREFDPSYVLHLEPPKRRGPGWCRFRLSETKGRMGPTFSPVELVMEPDFHGDGSVWTMVEAEEKTKGEAILEHLDRYPDATSQSIAEAVKTTPGHVRSVRSKARRGEV